jgi:hypothetical protein
MHCPIRRCLLFAHVWDSVFFSFFLKLVLVLKVVVAYSQFHVPLIEDNTCFHWECMLFGFLIVGNVLVCQQRHRTESCTYNSVYQKSYQKLQ